MKKLLFVIDSLSSGGAEKSLVNLLNLIDPDEYEVDLLLFSRKGLFLPLLPEHVRLLEPPALFGSRLRTLLRSGKARLLLLRCAASLALRNPWLQARLHRSQIAWNWLSRGIPRQDAPYDAAIAYSQGMPTYFVSEKVSAKRKLCWVNTDYQQAKYNEAFDRKYYASYQSIVTVSEAGKDSLVNAFPEFADKVEVVYDIISPRLIERMAQQGPTYGDDFKGIRILTIGRLTPVKGYDLALQACKMLKDEGLDVRWYVIGEGEMREELEGNIRDLDLSGRFILLGTHANPYAFLKDADIYVQPSRFEGFCMAVAEARMLHKPIVTTNFPAAYGQIRHGETGMIVGMHAHELYAGIKRYIEEPSLRERVRLRLQRERAGTEGELKKIYSLLEGRRLS